MKFLKVIIVLNPNNSYKALAFLLSMQNYDSLVEKIAELANIDREEVERRIEAKKAKLSGLISKEGAAQIVAAELGITFDNILLKISELMPGMKKVNLVGEIIEMFPVREYNKNNRQGKIGSFVIADETGNLRVVLWDTSHIELIEREEIKKGDVVEIKNASMRDNELHLSGFSEIKKSDKVLENVKREIIAPRKSIKELQPGQRVEVRGVIVQLFNPRFFNVCPECLKKVVQDSNGFSCAEHGRVQPKERALLNFVLDDGTETIRVVLFSEQIEKIIPEEDLKNPEKLEIFRKDYLGKEVLVKGVVKKNQLFNNMEIIGENIEEVDVDKLIEELEKSL